MKGLQDTPAPGAVPAWQRALREARLPLYDVHWPAAIVVEQGRDRKGAGVLKVGLADGRILPLTAWDERQACAQAA